MKCCFSMQFCLHKLRSNDVSLSRLQQEMGTSRLMERAKLRAQ